MLQHSKDRKNVLKNTMGQDRLNAVSVPSTEKDYISTTEDLNNKVIQKLAEQKYWKTEFLFK